MKRALVIFVMLITTSGMILGQTLSTQGVLRDSNGKSVTDGNYSMTFRLYTVETGGSNAWSETQTVTVKNGVYSVVLGNQKTLSLLDYNDTYYLAIVMDGTEMSPRMEMTLSPYALTNVQGIDNVFPKSGNVGVNTTSPNYPLTVNGNFQLQYSGTSKYHMGCRQNGLNLAETGVADNRLYVQDGGNIGIGTDNPQSELDVDGNVRLRGTHLVYHSEHGVIDWGNGSSGNLIFRFLGSTGDIGDYEQMAVLTSEGNLGIGSNSPVAKLDVRGDGYLYDSGENTCMTIASDNDHWAYMRFQDNDGADWDIASKSDSYSNGLQIRADGATPVAVFNKNGDLEIRGNIKLYGNLDFMKTYDGIRWGGSEDNSIKQYDNGSFIQYFSNGTCMMVYYNGNYFSHYSDMRLKENVEPLKTTLDKLKQLDAFAFNYKQEMMPEGILPKGDHYGLSAQEVQKVFPEVVTEVSHPTKSDESYLSLNYVEMVPVLVQAINEQQEIIEGLEKRLATLEKMVNAQ